MKLILALAFLQVCNMASAADNPVNVQSNLKAVTVYRTGAEMVHSTSVQLSSGPQELLIEGISNAVDMNSIQINCPSAVTIMGVEFGTNFLVAPEVGQRIEFLKDSADIVQREWNRLQVQIQTTEDLISVLKSNRDVKGQQNGLSVSELMKLMDYYKLKATELQNDLINLREKQKRFGDILSRIRTQVSEEESKNTRNAGQLKLQLSVATWGKYDFSISYITPNAWWVPFYDVRVEDIKSPLKVIYRAKISQTTGLDWKKVKLSLSTSLPTQWGNAPVLHSWFLTYINPVVAMDFKMKYNSIQSMDVALEGRTEVLSANKEKEMKIRGYANPSAGSTPLYIVNGAEMSAASFGQLDPNSVKSINVLKDANATSVYGARGINGVVVVTLKDGLDDYISVSDNELNVTFDIDLPYDVPTNGKEQTATLKEYAVDATYKYYAVPKLDKDAYLLAEVPEWEKLNLLPGDANIIFEGTYVGKSFIDPSSTADTLNLTLGRDKRVVVKKEKLADFSSTKLLGTNKLQKLTYELTVKNNKKDTVRMLLKDQYPLSTNKEIEVQLIDGSGAMNNTETGVLTWKLEIAPGETKKLRVSYSVKYPKDKLLNLN